jgi:hypothetical protein
MGYIPPADWITLRVSRRTMGARFGHISAAVCPTTAWKLCWIDTVFPPPWLLDVGGASELPSSDDRDGIEKPPNPVDVDGAGAPTPGEGVMPGIEGMKEPRLGVIMAEMDP